MPSLIEDVFRMEPVLVRLQGLHAEFATLDLSRYVCQRPILVSADYMSIRVKMRRAVALVLCCTPESCHTTEHTAHGPHIVAEDVLAPHPRVVAPRAPWAHANTEHGCKSQENFHLVSLDNSVRVACCRSTAEVILGEFDLCDVLGRAVLPRPLCFEAWKALACQVTPRLLVVQHIWVILPEAR